MDTTESQASWRRLESSLRDSSAIPAGKRRRVIPPSSPRNFGASSICSAMTGNATFSVEIASTPCSPTLRSATASLQACERALACLNRPQSPHQRLQVFYALGLIYLHLGESNPAQSIVDTALDLADPSPRSGCDGRAPVSRWLARLLAGRLQTRR